MEVLLYHQDNITSDMIKFCLESQFGSAVRLAEDPQQVLELFQSTETINLLVLGIDSGTEKFLTALQVINPHVSVLLIRKPQEENFKGACALKILAQISVEDVPEKLIDLIQKNFAEVLKESGEDEFCRISADLLARVGPLENDIYIRLSDCKFIKLFKAGTVFGVDDFKKIIYSKKVRNLYIKQVDSLEFLRKFKEDIIRLTSEAKEGDLHLLDSVCETHEMIHELAHTLGLTPEVQSLVKENIQLTLKFIGSSPRISNILSTSGLKGRNYISSHSVLLSNIACSISAQMDWPSSITFQKLVLASLFHDFVFQDPSAAKISTLKELDGAKAKLSEEQYQLVLNHPLKAADIIRNLREIPGDVEFLVFQHHERPDGSGFPKGLRSHQIMALSAVFIVAHDILNQMIALDDKFDLGEFLEQMETTYEFGAFRKIWKVLKQEIESNPPANSKKVA